MACLADLSLRLRIASLMTFIRSQTGERRYSAVPGWVTERVMAGHKQTLPQTQRYSNKRQSNKKLLGICYSFRLSDSPHTGVRTVSPVSQWAEPGPGRLTGYDPGHWMSVQASLSPPAQSLVHIFSSIKSGSGQKKPVGEKLPGQLILILYYYCIILILILILILIMVWY